MIEYQIVVADNAAELQDRVINHLADSWVPQGGLAEHGGMLVQAMIKLPPHPLVGIFIDPEQKAH